MALIDDILERVNAAYTERKRTYWGDRDEVYSVRSDQVKALMEVLVEEIAGLTAQLTAQLDDLQNEVTLLQAETAHLHDCLVEADGDNEDE